MRGLLLSVAVGLAGAALAAGACWGLQTVGLPAATRPDRIAADSATWLLRYRLATDTFHVGGRVRDGSCLHGWFPRVDGGLARGSLLVLERGPRILSLGGHVRLLSGRPQVGLPPRLALALGCTGELGDALGAVAQTDTRLHTERAWAAARPAIALRLPRRHGERVTLYVSARTYRPVAVAASLGGLSGTARVRLTKVTPHLLSRFVEPQNGRPVAAP